MIILLSHISYRYHDQILYDLQVYIYQLTTDKKVIVVYQLSNCYAQLYFEHYTFSKYLRFLSSLNVIRHRISLLGEGYLDQGFVFAWEDGRPIRPDYLYHRFKALLKEHGLPEVRIHDLRHTFCTLLLEAGEDLATISKLARHSSYSITADIYGHLTKTMQDRAAGKIDAILKRG